jgi:hypothetical protein
MKTLFLILVFQAGVILSLKSQVVTEYSYKLDNGINIKMDHCWNQVWVQQSYAALTAGDKTPLSISTRTLGDLVSNSSFKLFKEGKEVKMQGAAPGTYDLKLTFTLSSNPGKISFVVGNVIIKPSSKTSVSVTLYDYQMIIAESAATAKGFSEYETLVNRCKNNTVQDMYFGIPTFYTKGDHNKPVTPDDGAGKTKGKIKPGTYDLLVTIGISGQKHQVWLENVNMKVDKSYKISTNLNAGGIVYSGPNKEVKNMHLYPAGSADKQSGNPVQNKNIELISYDKVTVANCCSPGTYDVLLDIKNGSKFEWRKNIVIQTGTRTEVK